MSASQREPSTVPSVLDHLVYRASSLEAAIEELADLLGVRPAEGGRHPGRGSRNALLSLGERSYLEILAPDPDQPPPPPTSLLGSTEGPARLATWAIRPPDIEAAVGRALEGGVDLGPIAPMSRERADGGRLEWRLTTGVRPAHGLVPFLIDWGDAPHPAANTPGGCSLLGLRAEHPDPDIVMPDLTALDLQLTLAQAAAPGLIATIGTPRGVVELR
jgi:hypothetical protein